MQITKRERERVAKMEPAERLFYACEHVPEELAAGILAQKTPGSGNRYCAVGWLAALDAVPRARYWRRKILSGQDVEALAAFYGLEVDGIYGLMAVNDHALAKERHSAVTNELRYLYRCYYETAEE